MFNLAARLTPRIEFPKSKPIVMLAYVVLFICSIVWLPELLTGYSGPESKVPYQAISYVRGLGLFLFMFQLLIFGTALSLAANSLGYQHSEPGIFTAAIIGLAALIPAFYLRSLIGSNLGLPITQFELLFYSAASLFATRHHQWRQKIISNAIPLFLFWILCVALAQHEMPRTIMLSSDPDHHSFFAAQIGKYGFIPFSQQDWGGLSFGYPAATGVMIFIASCLSFSSIADAANFLPQLLAYIGLFSLVETLLRRNEEENNNKILFGTLISTFLVFHYALPYGLEPVHFHHEGYGRLLSLCFFALLVSWCLAKPSSDQGDRPNAFLACLVGGATLFSLVVINPVNGFLALWVFSLVFLFKHPSKVWMLLLAIPVLPMLLLEPYYLELVLGTTRSTGVIVDIAPMTVDTSVVIKQFLQGLSKWNEKGMSFFKLPYLTNTLTIFCFLFALSSLLRGVTEGFVKPFLILIAVYVGWLIFSAAFELLSGHPTYRLLLPYLQFNKEQFLYLLLFALLIPVFSELSRSAKRWRTICLFMALLGYGLSNHQEGNTFFIKTSRVGYCGSMGCLTADDKQVLDVIEQQYLSSTESTERILIPNASSQHGIEAWIMPRGGSRSMHFYQTYPVAFFYYQGDQDYSAYNYRTKVCENMDINWLKSKNIRYLFTPTHMMNACIFEYPNLDSKFEVLFKSGSSSFYQLY